MATKTPKLKTLKEGPCTFEELQAAFVKLAELHNGLNNLVKEMVASGRIKSTREVREDRMNRPFDF